MSRAFAGRWVLLALLFGLRGPVALGQEARPVPLLVSNGPAFDAIVPPGTAIEILAEGFDWSEGPVWMSEDGGFLLFSDVPRNTVYRWREGAGIDVYLRPSGYTGLTPRAGEPGSNGLVRDPEGRLVLMQHGDRRAARLMSDCWSFETLADRFEGKRFNSPNDAVYDQAGNLYFTDPPYGLPKNVNDPGKELDFQGVYRLSAGGELTVLTRELSRPNGIAVAPDQKTLYVANSDPQQAIWKAYPLSADGSLGDGHVVFDATAWVGRERPGLPDGMKVDAAGNLFATGPGGVHLFSPDGTHLGTIRTGVATANCGFGNDGSTLYITADAYLMRLRVNTKGQGF